MDVASSHALIELSNIERVFARDDKPDIRALAGLSLTIEEGEFVAIMGPSGSGKSTLLNVLGCLDRPTGGTYRLQDQDVLELSPDALAHLRCRKFGFVFQEYNLIEDVSSLENTELPSVYAGVNQNSRRKRAISLLDYVGLSNRRHHKAITLSGGEQQRVAIARALVNGARILLADEPTGSLDQQNTEIVMALLRDLVSSGWTVILVTHDQAVANRADRIVRLEQGRLTSDKATGAHDHTASSVERAELAQHSQLNLVQKLPLANAIGVLTTSLRSPLRNVLLTHRIRTFLSSLSVAVAVWSVTALVAVMNANYQQALENIGAMGGGAIDIRPAVKSQNDDPDPIKLTAEDAVALKQVLHVVHAVPLIRFGAAIQFRERQLDGDFVATTSDFAEVHDRALTQGQVFTQKDDSNRERVVVIGARAARELFPMWVDPVGQFVTIDEQVFEVKGILKSSNPLSDAITDPRDNQNYIPLSTAQLYLRNSDLVDSVALYTDDPAHIDAVIAEAAQILVRRHGERGFIPIVGIEQRVGYARLRQFMPPLIAAIAIATLAFGGSGVMSIMFIAVQRRIREIGIRMSCGARRQDILVQFLAEAIVITVFGGIVGLTSAATTLLVLSLLEFPASVPAWIWVSSCVSVVMLGAVCGIAPARRAATLDPVQALAR